MGLIGVIIASIVNFFVQSEALYWIISYVGVAVFVGLIAYDTQKIKAYALLALKSIEKGLGKLLLNEAKLHEDLEQNWAVVAEAIQTILRREGYPKPYEALKDLTRGNNKINKESIHAFIDSLQINATLKKELKRISPHNYTGIHPKY